MLQKGQIRAECLAQDVKGTWPQLMDNLDGTVGLARYARPGAWNDADLLAVRMRCYQGPSNDKACNPAFSQWLQLAQNLVLGMGRACDKS